MLTETGRVVGIEADGLWIETIRRTTCGKCAAQKGCGHGLLNSISDGKRSYIRVLAGDRGIENYNIDDQVLIGIPDAVILRGSFIAYILPLLAMLGGAMVAAGLLPGDQDGWAALGAVGGLACGFALVRWHGTRRRHDPGFQPTLLRVVSPLVEPVMFL